MVTVYIKNADILKWYIVGEKYEVLDEEIIINGKYKYLVKDKKHIINKEDCYTQNEIREQKLKRILYYSNIS